MEASIGLYRNDCDIILSHLKQHEKQLKVKRRWLMGKPVPKSKEKYLNFRSMPESLLREDDMFFATVTQHVEEAFGAKEKDNILEEIKDLLDSSDLKGIILSCLNALSNKGLFCLAMLLTRGYIDYGITRPKLKKEIRKLIRDKHCKIQAEIFAQICELLKDPRNVRDNCLGFLIPKFHPHYVSAVNILDRLEELPYDALFGMLRKLKGAPAGTLGLEHKRYGRSRTELICSIRRICKKLLLKLGRGDGLEGPLANALVAAGLLLKLSPGHSTSFVTDFNHISPEIRILQSEIAKAIQQLNVKGKVRFSKLEAFKLLVGRDAEVQNARLRTAIKKMLIAYLFECSDMDAIPNSFIKALAVINSSSPSMPNGCFSKDEKGEDVECILNLSAQIKQIVSGFLPDHDFDEDFTDAYMDELEESEEEDDNYGQTSVSCSVELDLEESFGEFVPVDSQINVDGHMAQNEVQSPQKLGPSNLIPVQISDVPEGSKAVDSEGEKYATNEGSAHTNTYLGIQEKCDETSMVAYDLIGQIMERFAQEEGIYLEPAVSSYLQGKCPHPEDRDEVMTCGENVEGSVVIQVVENLLPSLPKSTMEKLKELML